MKSNKLTRLPCRVPRGTRGLKHYDNMEYYQNKLSRPAWDAGIETLLRIKQQQQQQRRVPRGTRGLKQYRANIIEKRRESRPAWDAGIETAVNISLTLSRPCRVPRGTRGLKQRRSPSNYRQYRVASRVGRGD